MSFSNQPQSSTPSQEASTDAANGSLNAFSEEPSALEMPTKPQHRRNRSSVDGTKYKDGTWSAKNEKILMGPYDYMHGHPGKDVRRQLIQAFNSWLQVPEESLAVIDKVVRMLHTASLL